MLKKLFNYYHSIADGPKKVLHNMNWLFWDSLLRMGIGFFVGIAIARYFGPENYGILNYSIAFVFLFSFLSSLGLDTIVVRELINNQHNKQVILGSVFILKLVGGLSAFFAINVTSYFLHGFNSIQFILILIISFGFIFQSFNVIGIYFLSKVEGKYNIFATGLGFFISSLLKLLVIYYGKGIIYLAFITSLEFFICIFSYLYVYHKFGGGNILKWKYDSNIIKAFLKEGLPLAIASIGYLLYARIDQIIIGNMLGAKSVGYYSIAVSLSEAPTFLGGIIGSSLFPAVVASKKMGDKVYKNRLKLCFSLTSLISIIVTVIIFLLSNKIVLLFFGIQYINSIIILQIYIWSLIITFFWSIFGLYLVNENKSSYIFYSSIFGCILNVIFNLILIPLYGLPGAAFATVIPIWLSLITYVLFSDTRDILLFSLKSFNPVFIVKYAFSNGLNGKK